MRLLIMVTPPAREATGLASVGVITAQSGSTYATPHSTLSADSCACRLQALCWHAIKRGKQTLRGAWQACGKGSNVRGCSRHNVAGLREAPPGNEDPVAGTKRAWNVCGMSFRTTLRRHVPQNHGVAAEICSAPSMLL